MEFDVLNLQWDPEKDPEEALKVINGCVGESCISMCRTKPFIQQPNSHEWQCTLGSRNKQFLVILDHGGQ
jgi:hypothetical protein